MRSVLVGLALGVLGSAVIVKGVAVYVRRHPLLLHHDTQVPVYFVGEPYRDARGDIWQCTKDGWKLFVSYDEGGKQPTDPARPLTLLKDEA